MKEKKGKILIVDDHKSVLNTLDFLLQFEFEKVITVSNPNLIPEIIKSEDFDIVLLDMNFSSGVSSGNEGIYWLNKILKLDPAIVVILITAYGDVELAVKAIKKGATDFILKPWDNKKLLSTLQAGLKLRETKREVKKLQSKQLHLSEDMKRDYNSIIGNSPVMKEIYKTINKVAGTDVNVLILGENGTGKELIAREIHRQSRRADEVLISVDMAALSESLFESELFGHVKGAFTDAKEDRAGRFETASGGTLFLDEIGNLSMSLQAKLLMTLQNREIIRLGTNIPVPVDIRLISATNKDLEKMIKQDLFREDLLYRINTIQITIPPLRERGEDIILLTEHFLRQYAKKYDKLSVKISNKAIAKLNNYHWPGNIRELKHAVEKAVILCESDVLKAEDFFIERSHVKTPDLIESLSLEESEKSRISEALINNSGHLSETAKELKIARQTLYRKIKKYGL